MVGPVLLQESVSSSMETVSSRLDFINGDLKKVEDQVSAKEGNAREVGETIRAKQKALKENAMREAQQAASESTQMQV